MNTGCEAAGKTLFLTENNRSGGLVLEETFKLEITGVTFKTHDLTVVGGM